jgi:hypothetical protein
MQAPVRIALLSIVAAAVVAPIVWKMAPGDEPPKAPPRRVLPRAPKAPEPAAKWYGFKSVEEHKAFDAISPTPPGRRRGPGKPLEKVTKEQAALIRELLTRDDARAKGMAIALIGKMGPNLQKDFVPDLRALFEKEPDRKDLRAVLNGWLRNDGVELVGKLRNDQSEPLAKAATLCYEKYWSGGVSVGGA